MRFGRGLSLSCAVLVLACGKRAPKEPVAKVAPEPPPACAIRGPVYTQPAPGPIDPKPAVATKPAEPTP